jgi:AcrR family transcriptional regulator
MTDLDQALIDAVIAETVEFGRFDLSIERVSARSGISLAELRGLYPDVQTVVEAVHDAVFERFLDRLTRACDAQTAWPLKVKVGIGVALDLAAASPATARFLMLDSLAADRPLALRAIESRERLAGLLAAGRSETALGASLPVGAEKVLVAGVSGVILARLVSGEAEHLPALAPQLVELTLLFYLGPEEAAEVARRPRPGDEDR